MRITPIRHSSFLHFCSSLHACIFVTNLMAWLLINFIMETMLPLWVPYLQYSCWVLTSFTLILYPRSSPICGSLLIWSINSSIRSYVLSIHKVPLWNILRRNQMQLFSWGLCTKWGMSTTNIRPNFYNGSNHFLYSTTYVSSLRFILLLYIFGRKYGNIVTSWGM